jgi:hypothetical protein
MPEFIEGMLLSNRELTIRSPLSFVRRSQPRAVHIENSVVIMLCIPLNKLQSYTVCVFITIATRRIANHFEISYHHSVKPIALKVLESYFLAFQRFFPLIRAKPMQWAGVRRTG